VGSVGTTIHPALAPCVASLTAYDVDLGAPGVHRGLPGTTLTLVLPVGEPLDVGWPGVPGSRDRRWSTVSGLHARPAQIHHDGTQVGVQLGLTTAGAMALLGVPAAALAGQLLELADVDPWLRHLPEQLAEARPQDRAGLVAAVLLRRLGRRPVAGPPAAVGHALARLTRGAGVQETADEVGYSRRHLGALVRRECGLTPQEVRRVGRFERSRALLGRVPLAEAAQRCGYADQAHLTREWVVLAGCPPTTWLREEFPFLQDLGGAAARE
jgi:AraC-like DNA-binding protein